jgi:hypothetical protein
MGVKCRRQTYEGKQGREGMALAGNRQGTILPTGNRRSMHDWFLGLD